jgi:fructose/tagatose bisphosphate aldolase
MALFTTKELFRKALDGHYAIGAFNFNNMETLQAIVEACGEERSPVILQVSQDVLENHTLSKTFFLSIGNRFNVLRVNSLS